MHKQEFLAELRNALSGLPQDDLEERMAFYREMIDDRIEEGMCEEDAVAGIGTVDALKAQIFTEIPLQKLVKEKVKPKRPLRAWEVVLIVLGSPLWFPLIAAAGALVLSLYLVVWSLILSLWVIEVSLWVCVLGALAAVGVYLVQRSPLPALMMLGAALVVAGVSIFLFFGCIAASGCILKQTKKAGAHFKSAFVRKEDAK